MKYLSRIYLTLVLSFLIGTHEGFIALWTDPAGEPAVVFPYSAASLPPADRKALEKGIPVDTPEQLNRLLEDYLS